MRLFILRCYVIRIREAWRRRRSVVIILCEFKRGWLKRGNGGSPQTSLGNTMSAKQGLTVVTDSTGYKSRVNHAGELDKKTMCSRRSHISKLWTRERKVYSHPLSSFAVSVKPIGLRKTSHPWLRKNSAVGCGETSNGRSSVSASAFSRVALPGAR